MRVNVGIREFKNRATQYFRQIREEKTEVIVTMDGIPIARVIPIQEGREKKERDRAFKVFLEQVEKISKDSAGDWIPGENAVEAVISQRREL